MVVLVLAQGGDAHPPGPLDDALRADAGQLDDRTERARDRQRHEHPAGDILVVQQVGGDPEQQHRFEEQSEQLLDLVAVVPPVHHERAEQDVQVQAEPAHRPGEPGEAGTRLEQCGEQKDGAAERRDLPGDRSLGILERQGEHEQVECPADHGMHGGRRRWGPRTRGKGRAGERGGGRGGQHRAVSPWSIARTCSATCAGGAWSVRTVTRLVPRRVSAAPTCANAMRNEAMNSATSRSVLCFTR